MSLLTKASLVVTPNAYKEGKLFSVIPNTSLGDMDVTRATTATRVNAQGLIEVVPRNLLTYSNDFSNASWVKTLTTVASGQVGYDGTSNAWLLTSTSIPNPYVRQVVTVNVNDTFSVYLKKGTLNWCFILISGSTTANFDLQNGVVGTLTGCSASIVNVGNGWYRCSVTPTTTGTNVRIYPALSDNNTNGLGNIIIQNAQLEQGSAVTTYFPTTTRLNIPRIDYSNGSCPSLLVEPQRTNLMTYSQEFDNVAWNKANVTITANTATSPSNVVDADTLDEGISNNTHNINNSLIVTSGVNNTISVYVKKATMSFFRLILNENLTTTGWVCAQFNLDTLTYTSGVGSTGTFVSASITSVGNGWYRCVLVGSLPINGTALFLVSPSNGTAINSADSRGRVSYLGTSKTMYIWGAQSETGAYPTSYIPTIASTVTRNQDVISKIGIGDLIGQTEGVMFIESSALSNDLTARAISISDGTSAQRIFINYSIASNQIQLYGTANGVSFNSSIFYTLTDETQFAKIAVRYKVNNISLWVNGINRGTLTSQSLPVNLSRFGFDSGSVFSPFYGKTKQVQLYKTYLTDSEMALLTTL